MNSVGVWTADDCEIGMFTTVLEAAFHMLVLIWFWVES
jgi:hypothetical protein